MTPALLLARDCIIYSVNVWLVPVECAFNNPPPPAGERSWIAPKGLQRGSRAL